MRSTKAIASTLLLGLAATSVQAGGYIGIDSSAVSVNSQSQEELNPHGLRLRLGLRISEVFDLEAHLGGGTDRQTASFDEFGTSYAGAYLKAYLPIGQRSALFGLAGLAGIEYSQRINRQDFTDSQSGFSYGFGLETQLTDRLDLSADYILYSNAEGPYSELSAVNFGIKWYF